MDSFHKLTKRHLECSRGALTIRLPGPHLGSPFSGPRILRQPPRARLLPQSRIGSFLIQASLRLHLGTDLFSKASTSPPTARRFVSREGSKFTLQIVHPVGLIMDLQVVLADPEQCAYPGIIDLILYTTEVNFGTAASGYMIASWAENLRKNSKEGIIRTCG